MMKKIAVVAMEIEYAQTLCGNLSEYLSQYADFRFYSLDEVTAMDFIQEDFVVITTFTIFEGVKRKMRGGSELIVVSLTLNKKGVEPLYELPKGTRALLVNFDYRTCVQTITNLYGVGFNYLELVPYFGTGDYDRSIRLAITPNEARLVPEGISRVIDIGESVVDFNGLYHIAEVLGVAEVFAANEAILAKKAGFFSNFGIERVLGENESLMERVSTLLKLMKQGIILTDVVGNIHTCNEKAERLLQNRSDLLVGFNIAEILPEMRAYREGKAEAAEGRGAGGEVWLKDQKEELLSVDGVNLIAAATPIETDGVTSGFIVTLDNFEEIEEKQHGMRSKLSQVEHVARYRFEDIRGGSRELREVAVTAKRMARSDASVLITGESGTGKEVFAQSIHNESPRARYNFVAVNCAAIPENLLESEMFGYEEGSFTGARKGGKIGYFELAHRGTIFLDEIAEMPLLLQSKLLRVIEEREIIKIGSQKVVSVDVRIIAATNKNLYHMVESGTFREDLYYRLNVLPLHIPPLRERVRDLDELLLHFMKQQGRLMRFTDPARQILERYHWRGNIRELRNVVEYLASLEKEEIVPGDLPPFEGMRAGLPEPPGLGAVGGMSELLRDPGALGSAEAMSGRPGDQGDRGMVDETGPADDVGPNEPVLASDAWGTTERPGGQLVRSFLLQEGKSLDLYRFVLREFLEARAKRQRPGRLNLLRQAEEKGEFYTEAEIRRSLARLGEYGFVRTGSGRGGGVITRSGEEALWEIERFLR